jgi:hypothetical protein
VSKCPVRPGFCRVALAIRRGESKRLFHRRNKKTVAVRTHSADTQLRLIQPLFGVISISFAFQAGDFPGVGVRILSRKSSSEFRTILNVTFAFAMSCYACFRQNGTIVRRYRLATMFVLDARFDPIRQISSNVEISGSLIQ